MFLVVFFADLFGLHTNPYIGIVFFLILPGIFIFGLILIPLGAWIERRRRAAGQEAVRAAVAAHRSEQPGTSAASPSPIFALTMANIVIVSLAAYRGVEYMDSVQFCGQACHTRDEAGGDRAPGRPARARHVRRSATSAPARPGSPSRSCRARASCSR